MITFRKHHDMEFRGLLIELVKLFQPEVYCEVGVKKGYTFNAIAPLVKIAIGIDPAGFSDNTKELSNQKAGICLFEMRSDDYASFHCDFTKPKPWASKPLKIDFLFIDGDHSAQQVKKDIIQFLPFVQEDTGLIFLHDTYPVKPKLAVNRYCGDAWKVADRIHHQDRSPFLLYNESRDNANIDLLLDLEIVTLPGPWAGLSILRKRGERHLHWQG